MKFIRILILTLCCMPPAWAQNSAETTPPPAVALRPVSAEQWRTASEELDYSDDQPKAPKRKKERKSSGSPTANRDWTVNTEAWGQLLQVLAIGLAVVGLAFGIYKMLIQPRNRAIAKSRDGVEITLDNLEEYLHETDLERFLRAALANGNYALAVRLYYLQIIKDLSAKNAIHWAREKTNRDYLRELRGQRLVEPFRTVTRHFERVWYGNLALTQAEFARLEPEFKNFLAQI